MTEQLHDVPFNEIWADDEWNVRGVISPASVISLADDIRIAGGLLQPIVLQRLQNVNLGTKYKIVLGHRRFAALNLLAREDKVKWGTAKSRILERVITECEALLMNLNENLERVDLNMLQEANGIKRFKAFGWDASRIAKELSKPKKWVESRLGLLTLPEEIQRRAAAGYLTQYQIASLMDMNTVDEQMTFVRAVVDNKERGKKIPTATKKEKRQSKTLVTVMTRGSVRTIAEIALVQESLQDAFQDIRHPAAMALAFAAGVLSYDEFVENHVQKWLDELNDERANNNLPPIEFKHHEEIAKEVA